MLRLGKTEVITDHKMIGGKFTISLGPVNAEVCLKCMTDTPSSYKVVNWKSQYWK